MNKGLKLKQSNNLILATHRMNIQQMRLFFYACSQYQGDLEINVSLDEINRVLAYQGGNQRDLVKDTIPTIMRNAIVHLIDEDGEEWCSALRKSRLSKDGTVTFVFDKSIQKELEELRGYTWMYLSNLTGMTSTYSVRLYEFFAMRLGTHNTRETFDFDLNKLRIYLDCVNKYKRFDLFDMRVLKQALKEINEKTNIKMSYKKIKTGRSVTSVKFDFSWKTKADIIDVKEMDHQKSVKHSQHVEQLGLDDFLKQFE